MKTDIITVYKGWLIVQISQYSGNQPHLGGMFVMIYEFEGFNVEYGKKIVQWERLLVSSY